jgi:UDP-N-acetylglucosamine acyltransferase
VATFIHPTAIIEDGVTLGDDCEIQAGAVIRRHTILGDRVVVHPGAVIGGDPQFLKFDRATQSGVRIGTGTTLREHVTVNRSIHAGGYTTLGEGGFLMAGAHIGHDCAVGDQVVLANDALLAGHVSVGASCFIGGGAAVHQFSRIGEGVMIGGLSRITRDLAPFIIVSERDEISGLNLVGLKRRGVPREAIRELKAVYREVFYTPGNIRDVAAAVSVKGHYTSKEARLFLEFFASGKRSFARPARVPAADTSGDE